MDTSGKKLLLGSLLSLAGGCLIGFVLWNLTHDKQIALTTGGMLWFVGQCSVVIKTFDHNHNNFQDDTEID